MGGQGRRDHRYAGTILADLHLGQKEGKVVKRGRIYFTVKSFLTTDISRPWNRWLGTREPLPFRGLLTLGAASSGECDGLVS